MMLKYGAVPVLVIIAGLVWGKNLIEYFFKTTSDKFNIQFSKLHNDRAEVIREFMKRLLELREAMRLNTYNVKSSWEFGLFNEDGSLEKMHSFPPQAKDASAPEKLIEAFRNTYSYFYQYQMYFNKGFCVKVFDMLSKYRYVVKDTLEMNFMHLEFWDEVKLDEEKLRKNLKEIDPIIEELGDEFRSILGVD